MIELKVKYDALGHILAFELGPEVQHSEELTDNVLQHYGRLGMKWGVRNRSSGGSSGGGKIQEGNRRAAAAAKSGGGSSGGKRDPNQVVTSRTTLKKLKNAKPVEVRDYGKKGLKVGGGKGHGASVEAILSAAGRQKAHASGVHTLSNDELRAVVNRMNLEQSYAKLNPKKKGIIAKGAAIVAGLIQKAAQDDLARFQKGDQNSVIAKSLKSLKTKGAR